MGADIKHSSEIGLNGSSYRVNCKCLMCGATRYIRIRHESAPICRNCYATKIWAKSGPNHPRWAGGFTIDKNGYRVLTTKDGAVREHRLVIERQIGRKLMRCETVHHKNGIRDDNRPENLEVWVGNHGAGWRLRDYLRGLTRRELGDVSNFIAELVNQNHGPK